MHLNQNEIQSLHNFFNAQPVLKAFVFGSYARNEASINSDIDILVDLDYHKGIGFKFIEMQQNIQTVLGKKIDLVSSKGLSEYILPLIEKEKLLIYER